LQHFVADRHYHCQLFDGIIIPVFLNSGVRNVISLVPSPCPYIDVFGCGIHSCAVCKRTIHVPLDTSRFLSRLDQQEVGDVGWSQRLLPCLRHRDEEMGARNFGLSSQIRRANVLFPWREAKKHVLG
ncbi:MAG: hypothetical protein AAGG48_29155, partial [Planctomycetota bacterium]